MEGSSHRQRGYRFPDDWTVEAIQEQRRDYLQTVTIPVHVKLELHHRVYDFQSVDAFLRRASKIVVQDCPCRTRRGHCDAPRDVCLLLDDRADVALQRRDRRPREVTVLQAREALQRAHDAGLVLTSILRDGDAYPKTVCSCCSCCCYSLSGIVRFGLHGLVEPSTKSAYTDPSTCTVCGVCVGRCHFAARTIREGVLAFDPAKCLGCGLCVSTCPAHAVSLIDR